MTTLRLENPAALGANQEEAVAAVIDAQVRHLDAQARHLDAQARLVDARARLVNAQGQNAGAMAEAVATKAEACGRFALYLGASVSASVVAVGLAFRLSGVKH